MITITNEEKFEEWLTSKNWGCDLDHFKGFDNSTQQSIYEVFKKENND